MQILKKVSSVLILSLVLGFGISQLTTQPVYAATCPYPSCDGFNIDQPALGLCFVDGQTAVFYRISGTFNYCYSTDIPFP